MCVNGRLRTKAAFDTRRMTGYVIVLFSALCECASSCFLFRAVHRMTPPHPLSKLKNLSPERVDLANAMTIYGCGYYAFIDSTNLHRAL